MFILNHTIPATNHVNGQKSILNWIAEMYFTYIITALRAVHIISPFGLYIITR